MADATKWRTPHSFIHALGTGKHDLSADTLKIVLLLSSSNFETLAFDTYSELTNEVATNYGYTQGTKTLANVTWTNNDDGTVDLDADDVVWNASGGAITARAAYIYNEDAPSDELVCYCILDSTPADVTADDGNPFTIAIHATGIIRGTRASA